MSYICDKCKKATDRNVPCNIVAVEIKPVLHITKINDKNGFTREDRFKGTDIVKEQKLCPNCFKSYNRPT